MGLGKWEAHWQFAERYGDKGEHWANGCGLDGESHLPGINCYDENEEGSSRGAITVLRVMLHRRITIEMRKFCVRHGNKYLMTDTLMLKGLLGDRNRRRGRRMRTSKRKAD